MTEPAIRVRGISKTFAGQRALDDVSTSFAQGRITALLGQNGSGKSTLIKILAGFYEPDPGGSIEIGGEAMDLPLDAHRVHEAGLRFLHQDLAVVPEMTVIENFALVNGFATSRELGRISSRSERVRLGELLDRFEVGAHPDALVGALAPAQRTMVAIVRAFAGGGPSRVLVLDEPTASLPEAEADRIFGALRTAVEHGAGVIYVSHRIDEVQRLADQIVVLRDGRVVADRELAGLDSNDVVRLIVGHDVSTERMAPGAAADAAELELDDVHGQRLRGVSLRLARGEVLGLAGLLGCGRSELVRIVTGAQAADAGELRVGGKTVDLRSPRDARAVGIGYVPQDRRGEGIIAAMSVGENLTLPVLDRFFSGGVLRTRAERSAVQELIGRFDVRPAAPDRPIGTLSGGNQQKAVFARSVQQDPRVLVLDEPSQGIDVGARQEIAEIVVKMAAAGCGVLVGSSDNGELAQLCDRVLVLDRGALVEEIAGPDLTEERLTAACAATAAGSVQEEIV